jgi:hypothetical protein
LGQSPNHARSVALVLSLLTGYVSAQFHLKHDDFFETVRDLNAMPQSKWQELAQFTTEEMAGKPALPSKGIKKSNQLIRAEPDHTPINHDIPEDPILVPEEPDEPQLPFDSLQEQASRTLEESTHLLPSGRPPGTTTRSGRASIPPELFMEQVYAVLDDSDAVEDYELLQKTICGLVQSARQFYKKLVYILRKKLNFKGGYADPCLLTRRCETGIMYIALYVDDCFCCGHQEAIQDTVKQIQEAGFNVTIENEMTDYLSCEILFSRDRKKCWIGQPHLIRKLEKKFGEMVTTLQKFRTPGIPSCGIVRPTDDKFKVSLEDQTLYQSRVGMLLYLVKHSRPDIANVVRELSKVMDGATMAAMKEMKRVIKFVMDTKHLGLKIEPKAPDSDKMWDLVIYCDSDWAGDKDTRNSVAGFIVYLMGAPISWKSKAQRGVTLSSSEAEFVALSEAAKETKFVVQVLISMGIPVRLPVICWVDNIGAIFMAENVSTSQRTKHIDTRYHFVREFVEENFIKIIFVRTKENRSDGFTKNVTGEIYDAHVETFMAEKTYLN